MLNILIAMAGKATFSISAKNNFPKILSEINGKLLLERAAEPFLSIKNKKKIVVAVPKIEAELYSLDKVLPLLDEAVSVCKINGNTQGAACSALLALEYLELDNPLIISSFDQVLDFDLNPYVNEFINKGVDAAVLTFDSIHPKWSFVKVEANTSNVIQVAEKKPISRNAIAGFYFFKTAKLFIESAKDMIRNDVRINNNFFVAPVLNEIILNNGLVLSYPINKDLYFHINDESTLSNYEEMVIRNVDNKNIGLINKTKEYISSFNGKDIDSLIQMFDSNAILNDSLTSLFSREKIINYLTEIFRTTNKINFKEKNIFMIDNNTILIEFSLALDDKKFVGTDIIKWNSSSKIIKLDAYLYEVQQNGKV